MSPVDVYWLQMAAMSVDEDLDQRADRLGREGCLRWVGLLSAGMYAWQLEGVLLGVATAVGLYVAGVVRGYLSMRYDRYVLSNRVWWAVLWVTIIILAGSNAEVAKT